MMPGRCRTLVRSRNPSLRSGANAAREHFGVDRNMVHHKYWGNHHENHQTTCVENIKAMTHRPSHSFLCSLSSARIVAAANHRPWLGAPLFSLACMYVHTYWTVYPHSKVHCLGCKYVAATTTVQLGLPKNYANKFVTGLFVEPVRLSSEIPGSPSSPGLKSQRGKQCLISQRHSCSACDRNTPDWLPSAW
jgi:hypothetical protein